MLLYCGDFDPAGLLISNVLRDNLRDLAVAVGWSPDEDNLTIERFGLNHDFIVANNITWVDGLKTGGGLDLEDPNHSDHDKAYVQDYLRLYGAGRSRRTLWYRVPWLAANSVGKPLPSTSTRVGSIATN